MIGPDAPDTQDVTAHEFPRQVMGRRGSDRHRTASRPALSPDTATLDQPTEAGGETNALAGPTQNITGASEVGAIANHDQHTLETPAHSDAEQRVKRAQASILFDSMNLALLRKLADVRRLPLARLEEVFGHQSGWISFGLFMQASFAEVRGKDLFITPEGLEAVQKVELFTKQFRSESN